MLSLTAISQGSFTTWARWKKTTGPDEGLPLLLLVLLLLVLVPVLLLPSVLLLVLVLLSSDCAFLLLPLLLLLLLLVVIVVVGSSGKWAMGALPMKYTCGIDNSSRDNASCQTQ
jgi:hypothetical protein